MPHDSVQLINLLCHPLKEGKSGMSPPPLELWNKIRTEEKKEIFQKLIKKLNVFLQIRSESL
jgi:hypothetical protein